MAGAAFETRVADAQRRLARKAARGPSPRICGPRTDLVVEGPPRCANSFTVRVLQAILGRPPIFRIAHHSHGPDNLWAGAGYGIPLVVLARPPEDAIASYRLWSGKPLGECAARYADFYDGLEGLERLIIGHFAETTGDFGAFLARLAPSLARPVPPAAELGRLVAQINAERQAILAAKRPDGTPAAADRKEAARQEVLAHLAADPRPHAAYARLLASAATR